MEKKTQWDKRFTSLADGLIVAGREKKKTFEPEVKTKAKKHVH